MSRWTKYSEYLAFAIIIVSCGVANNLAGYWGTSVVLIQLIYFDHLRAISDRALGLLPLRLEAYAHLKGPIQKGYSRSLSYQAHEVLLGTLKKVEAKAASLLVVLSLTLTLTVTLAAATEKEDVLTRTLLYITTFAHPFAIISVLSCFEQRDSMDIYGGISLEDELQAGLMSQLLTKELKFRFSFDMTRAIMLFGFGGLATWMLPDK